MRTGEVAFVFGALRSGTTMFWLMLNAHPDLSNPGEADFLFDFLHLDAEPRYDVRALTADRIFNSRELEIPDGMGVPDLLRHFLDQLDPKMPGLTTLNIHRHPDRVAALMPEARIIHLLRDPRDVARSSIGMGWAGTLYHGVDHWIATESAWDRAAPSFAYDRILELKFEDLLADPEGELRRVCAFLDVEFNPGMLEYHRASTCEPPDPSLAEQWRRKSSPREIAQVESKAGELMRRRGYALSGEPARVPNPLERAGLAIHNKAAIWRFGAKRFGPFLYFCEKLSRWAGLEDRNQPLRLRMNEIAN